MIYRRGKKYWVKFKFQGRTVQRATGTEDLEKAREIERKIKKEFVDEKWGAPSLKNFIRHTFLPLAKMSTKEKTLKYYKYGISLLAPLHSLPLDKINHQEVVKLVQGMEGLSPSTINCALRTLKRVLKIGERGGYRGLHYFPLLGGEKRRERTLTQEELKTYLKHANRNLRHVAIFMSETGMRPSEVFCLRWEDIGEDFLKVRKGKSKNAQRLLPLTPLIREVLRERGEKEEGFIFAQANKDGHLNHDSIKKAHRKAISKGGLKYFPPYTLRHSALTELAKESDPFTLMKISGHSDIKMLSRYVHPELERVKEVFQRKCNHPLEKGGVVTKKDTPPPESP